MSGRRGLRLFLNEPDIYESIDFQSYKCIDCVWKRGDAGVAYGSVDAVLVGLRELIDDRFLSPFASVKYVVSNTTGIDHIRTARAVEIIHLDPSEIGGVSATAEFTLGLLLALVRQIPFVEESCVDDRLAYRGVQLRGKKLGIFGMGRLGRMMARYAEALEMSWVGYDRGDGGEEKMRMLRSCDILTLHLPVTEETVGFIGKREFGLMQCHAFLINTSRPQLIDRDALLDALDRSLIAGVAMDFVNYDGTNVWDPDLKKYVGRGLLMTPHIAGNTHESVQYTANIVVEKLLRRSAGEL